MDPQNELLRTGVKTSFGNKVFCNEGKEVSNNNEQLIKENKLNMKKEIESRIAIKSEARS